jgi:hypothetical protein
MLISRLREYLVDQRARQRIAIALARGSAMMTARSVDLRRPHTWEFSGFSQNGEDGILDVLRRQIRDSNRYFLEIGASDGVENNSAWLLVAEKYSGVMIDGDAASVERASRTVVVNSVGAESRRMFVTRDNIDDVRAMIPLHDPDVFSLDIDGNDYHIAQAMLVSGFRPRIVVVEYNSVYGSARSMTISYQEAFVFTEADPTWLYYGASLAAWRKLFQAQGYRFVTVERNGVNAFFVDPAWFDEAFLDGIQALAFAENRYQHRKFKVSSEEQFNRIIERSFITV